MQVSLAAELVDILHVAVLEFAGVRIVEHETALDAPFARVEARVRTHPPDESAAVRSMYRKTGLDPTKRRPSSEALLRRVRKGEGLPRINSLVDVCNWCSLEFQLPYGLYDLAHVEGEISLRLGRDGESYPGIRKDDVHVAGRITLADDRGPFGNPSSDSARTMVTTATTDALIVIFAPIEVESARLREVAVISSERVRTYCSGVERSAAIV